jgi:nicotinamide riboside transporter PnuC
MAETISWVATIATVIAASMTAANLGSRITGYGFVIFTLGALCWIAVGVATGQPALTWTNVVLTILDIFGIWRWLGRQAKVEEGARTAAERSEGMPTETLFPVSLLTRAPVRHGATELGR